MNPYAPPRASVDDARRAAPEVETQRREHLEHEASVCSIGALYYVGSVLLSLFGLVAALIAVTGSDPTAWPIAIACLVLGVASVVVAWGLRRLKPWAAVAAIVLSAISLPAVPFGTALGAYVLVVLLSAKGRKVFAPDYANIVAATPHIEPGASIVVWIIFVLLTLFMAALVVFGLMLQ